MTRPTPLRIHRDRFLVAVVAIAGEGCRAEPADRPAVVAPVVTAPVGAVTAAPEPVREEAPSENATETTGTAAAERASDCERENDEGGVDCSVLDPRRLTGPTCEGVIHNCSLLEAGQTYRARPARVAMACMARGGKASCQPAAKRKCFEEAIRATCPDPQYASACQGKMEECRRANRRVTYTKEECVKAMSALLANERAWAIDAMGPTSEGACRLAFAVY